MKDIMRAQVIEKPGEMVLKNIPIPTINDDEVLIKVKMCGICGTDGKIFSGEYAAQYLPMTSGHEFWGTIEKLGQNVKSLEIGDRVSVDICLPCGSCYFCRRGEGLLCQTFTQLGIHTDGAFAEYVKAPSKNCYKIPKEVDDYSAAFIEPLTAVMQASKKMNVSIASSVVIIGCGLGVLHAKMAKLRGAAPVILIGTNDNKMKIAKDMDAADYYINPSKTDAVKEVMRITEGIGADFVLEAVGTVDTYEQAFKMLRRGGVLEAFGVVGKGKKAQFEPFEFVLGEKKVRGSCAGIGNDWEDVISLLQYKRIDPKPMFSSVVPLEDLEDALIEIKQNKNIVKMFVSPEIDKRIDI